MDFVFYVIYNAYFKHGDYKNDIPPLTVWGIFTVIAFCFLLLLMSIRTFLLQGALAITDPFSKTQAIVTGWLCGVLVYFLFYYKKRYVRIYHKYKDNALANSWQGKVMAWLIVLLLTLSPFIFIFIRRNVL